MFQLFPIHQMYGHILNLILLIEVGWTFYETFREIDPARVSTIKSRAVVGLLDLQALLGFGLLYQYWPHINHTHPVLMILGVVGFHVANKQSGWNRFGLQCFSYLTIVFGYVLVVG